VRQKRVTPASVQLRAPWRVVTVEKLTHEQFNGKEPLTATSDDPGAGPSAVSV